MFALKRLTFAAAVAVLVLMSDSGPSQAGDFFLDQQRVVKPRLIIQRGETLRRRIRQIVEGRLRPDRPSVGPAGISALGAVISPVAAEADGSPLWGSWVDTSYTHLDGDEPGAPFDGPQVAVGTGLDYAVSERLVVGAEFNYDFAEIDNNFGGAGFGPGRLKSHSYGVGPYLGYAVTDNILFDASFTYSWGENDISDQVSTGSFDNEGWSATANLTGYVDLGSNLTLAPSAGIAYSYNRDDPFVDSAADFFPAQTIHTGVFNFGATLSYFHVLDDVRSIEPSISVEASYEFEIFGEPPLDSGLVASNVNDPGLALSVTGGLDITLSEAVSMSVTGGVGGIGRSNYLEASGGAQVGVQF
jgi:outer membrane autotransporter protein